LDPASTVPNDLMAEYYEQRASGAGIIITEATSVSEEGGGWRNAPHMRDATHVEAWKKIVDRVHAKGSIIYLQLWHIGRQSHSSFHPSTGRIVSASPIPHSGQQKATTGMADPEIPHELTTEEVQATIRDFVNTAKLAKEAGFDGVALHSANGYLLDCFFQSSTNQRTDQYGGSIENRCRMVKEIVQGIIDIGAYPANRIAFRLSPNGVFGDMGSEDNFETFIGIAKIMNEFGMAFLDVMVSTVFGGKILVETDLLRC
jgi:N-ethylmaleimide reductase